MQRIKEEGKERIDNKKRKSLDVNRQNTIECWLAC
jgi:hypothetical protein